MPKKQRKMKTTIATQKPPFNEWAILIKKECEKFAYPNNFITLQKTLNNKKHGKRTS